MSKSISIPETARNVKRDSFMMASLSESDRNDALKHIAETLDRSRKAIYEANDKDLLAAAESGLPGPIIKRLKFNEEKLDDVISGLRTDRSKGPSFQNFLKESWIKI